MPTMLLWTNLSRGLQELTHNLFWHDGADPDTQRTSDELVPPNRIHTVFQQTNRSIQHRTPRMSYRRGLMVVKRMPPHRTLEIGSHQMHGVMTTITCLRELCHFLNATGHAPECQNKKNSKAHSRTANMEGAHGSHTRDAKISKAHGRTANMESHRKADCASPV